ncbi:hypothetical protein Syun_004186 [Stephania yunnanensis]|uniref:Uncharacterized protein n=1 Tax=Stephania yunnanensis TaxID=152371 RepID=A0AAP0Q2B0_9MAGN
MAFYFSSMRFIDIIEPHNPTRVLRQMRYVQGVPKKSYKPIFADMSKLAYTYLVKYNYDPLSLGGVEDHLIARELCCERAIFPWQAAPRYI